jgi:hypothetical protein
MATPPNKLILTRDQIAAFVGDDPRAIKQIEKLFTLAQSAQESNGDAAAIDAGAALAGVNKLAGVVAQLAQDGAIEASNAVAIAEAAKRALVAVEALAMVGATLPPSVPSRGRVAGSLGAVGAWHDTTDQAPAVINTAYPVTLNSVDIERGIWRDSVNTSRIYVADAGVYNFETSVQLDKVGGGAPLIWIWARVNGVNVPDSASLIHLQGAADETIFAANWLLTMAPNDYFELVWASDDVGSRLESFPAAAPVPAIPSVILTATQEG